MKKILSFVLVVVSFFLLSSCDLTNKPNKENYNTDIYYTLFVRSFADSDNDGIGDLNGITENLDYLEDLGVTGLWLLPIFESPSYHGYDTTNYYEINSDYGTMEDLDNLIKEASNRGIKILLDLVINHTSDQHPWYIDSKANGEYRDYYVWNNGYAYESFVGGMKDLNLDNPEVFDEIKNISKFYLDKGIKGFRLDAVSHFFEESGASLQIAYNTLFMSRFNNYIKTVNEDAFIVGEVFEYDYNIVSQYVKSQTSYFNFYISREIEEKIGKGNSSYLFSRNLERAYNAYDKIRTDYIDSPFIANHDMDRVASKISSLERLKLMANVLLTLPGNPFIYYGDEIGLKGKRYEGTTINGRVVYDEYRRQPFLWGDDYTTLWLGSDGSNDDTLNLLVQKEDPNSLYNAYKRIIEVRKKSKALMEGNEFYSYNLTDIQGYLRVLSNSSEKIEDAVLVLHNTSSKTILVDIDLKVLFGNKELGPYETVIFKVPANKVGEYK